MMVVVVVVIKIIMMMKIIEVIAMIIHGVHHINLRGRKDLNKMNESVKHQSKYHIQEHFQKEIFILKDDTHLF